MKFLNSHNLLFNIELSEEEIEKKREEAKRHRIWGKIVEGRIASKLHLIPLTVYVSGKPMKMGGVCSVATWPEFRRSGMVKELLANALQYMRDNGQVLSFLHPFSVPFYRKYGWEVTFNEKIYTIPIVNLQRAWNIDGYVRRVLPEISLLKEIYCVYAKRYTGTILRDEKWWEQRVLKDDTQIAIAYNNKHQPEGYILFEVKDKQFTAIEMAYRSEIGMKLLLQFVSNHDSMVEKVEFVVPENDNIPLLLEEPRFDTKVDPYFMARIVDVHGFLEQYPFVRSDKERAVCLRVVDNFLPENSGLFHVKQSVNGVIVDIVNMGGQEVITCSIQQLTMIFLGYKRPTELFQLGLLQGNVAAINCLENMIPFQQTYLPDYF
ncbi:enhanced intracellular survival protein Eis [Paucisalibacillus sp. EB02]|uniref:GNAT family N-acetyltransferase n=1 Tax=Paucisalibacillus sp. EB02 TaxID=1347087 RepID=UPI0004B1D2F9|nr:GNAT family N-acetyltransferase [Paucisalibacillus sp. EB02]